MGQAVERALAANPALQGFAFTLKAQDARITQSNHRPATEVSVELENALGSGAYSGLDAAEATFALSQVIELGDKRQLRGAVARSGREMLAVDRQAAQLDVLAEVTRRFIAVAAAQEQLALTQTATALARGTVDDVSLRVRAAKSPEGELLRSRAASSRAELGEQRATAQLGAARQRLAAMWASSRPDYGRSQPICTSSRNCAISKTWRCVGCQPDFLRFASERGCATLSSGRPQSAAPDLAVTEVRLGVE